MTYYDKVEDLTTKREKGENVKWEEKARGDVL